MTPRSWRTCAGTHPTRGLYQHSLKPTDPKHIGKIALISSGENQSVGGDNPSFLICFPDENPGNCLVISDKCSGINNSTGHASYYIQL